MDESTVSLFQNTIIDYTKRRKELISQIIVDGSKTFYTHLANQIEQNSKQLDGFKALVKSTELIRQKAEERNKLFSGDFNMLRLFDIGETQHSHLLSHFLNPHANHGQKHLFLNIFLDLLQIKRVNDSENWIVTAEKGRIDVLLKRNYPHSVVVIENKSNYATDQDNQLYRYWYKEIYQPIRERYLDQGYIINPPAQFYQIIYLSTEHWKRPSTNTIEKPKGWPDNLPEQIPLKPKQILFNDFICNWLKLSLEILPENNHRLKEYVNQYIEYWN